MWIKASRKNLKLQSPEGSFVLFGLFVFVKTQAVRGLTSRPQGLKSE